MSKASNEWNKEHKEACRIAQIKYRAKNKLQIRAKQKRYILSRFNNYSEFVSHYAFSGNRLKTIERDDFKCVKCGMTNESHKSKFNRSITVDHIDGNGQYSKVKNNKLSNLQTLCLPCHGKKDITRRKYRPTKRKV